MGQIPDGLILLGHIPDGYIIVGVHTSTILLSKWAHYHQEEEEFTRNLEFVINFVNSKPITFFDCNLNLLVDWQNQDQGCWFFLCVITFSSYYKNLKNNWTNVFLKSTIYAFRHNVCDERFNFFQTKKSVGALYSLKKRGNLMD